MTGRSCLFRVGTLMLLFHASSFGVLSVIAGASGSCSVLTGLHKAGFK